MVPQKPQPAFRLCHSPGQPVARLGSGLMAALQEPLAKIERQYVDEVLASNDGNEGITAFIERRKPVWKDA